VVTLSPGSAAAINGPSMPPIPPKRLVARDVSVMIKILLVSETQTPRARISSGNYSFANAGYMTAFDL